MKPTRSLLAFAGILLAVAPAEAHHMIGGRLPASLGEGFLSGLGHPVIGLDHLLALVAVGLLARGPRAPIAFVVVSLIGVALPAFGFLAFASESLVAFSVVALGGLLLVEFGSDGLAAIVVAVAIGALHGFAYAEAIVGAEPTPLVAYLAGLALVELAIVGFAGWLAPRLTELARIDPLWLRRASGAAIAASGIALFTGLL